MAGPEELVDGFEREIHGRGGVDDGIHTFHRFVEGSWSDDVLHFEVFVLVVVAFECPREEMVLGGSGPRRASHFISLLEELEADVRGYVAIDSGHEDNLVRIGRSWHGGC